MHDTPRTLEDLRWCIQSAPLMLPRGNGFWPEPTWFDQWTLDAITPPTLTDYKLGLRFENIVAHWIRQTPSLQLLARNLPVHDGQRTIGEFDLIVNNQGTIEHWELAVKFYLGTGNLLDLDNWYGPNPVDTLARKIHRMESHQLKLSQLPAGKTVLQAHGWAVDKMRSIVKGRLFHPFTAYQLQHYVFPQRVNPDHPKGWWMTSTDFEMQPELQGSQFTLLERQNWLAPMPAVSQDIIMDHSQTVSMLKETSDSGTVHLARINAQGEEISRGFVVFPRWLNDVETGS